MRATSLVVEPDRSMLAAAEVVDAMADAASESGWLCVPSYVVIRTDASSAHLCICEPIITANFFIRIWDPPILWVEVDDLEMPFLEL